MSTYKNTTETQIDIPLLDLHVAAGKTFEVPDEFDAQFDANPAFTSSKSKHPDVTPDQAVVDSIATPSTGPVGVVSPQSAAIAPAAPDDVPTN